MIAEKIRNKFKDCSTPILLFFDKEQEYRDEILALEDEEFKVLEVNENYFRIKYEIEIVHPNQKFLLYHAFEKPTANNLKEYPLADLLYASEELLVDESADLLAKYAIHHTHTSLILQYKRFVKAAKYQSKLLPILSAKPFNEYKFQNAILSILLNEKKIGNDTFNLISLFESLNVSEDSLDKQLKIFQKEKLIDLIKEIVFNTTHVSIEEVNAQSIQSLFLKFKYNVITKNTKEASEKDPYKKLKIQDELALSKIDIFFKEWADDKVKSQTLDETLRKLGKEIDETKIIEAYDHSIEFGIKTNQIIEHELNVLTHLVNDNPASVIETLSNWQLDHETNKEFEEEVNFLIHAAKYYNLIKNYKDFDFNFIEDYIQKYEAELYKLDLNYRHAFTAFQAIDREKNSKVFQPVFKELNKNYDQFLIELNQSWLKILNENQFNINQTKVNKQYNFYKNFIENNTN
ncbi:MAG TPA: hypothetical protein DEQ26_15280, partial [Flavobacteriaceae bacterium]|nr:hypothetical protein [Flavobacteriaceae bacterium]